MYTGELYITVAGCRVLHVVPSRLPSHEAHRSLFATARDSPVNPSPTPLHPKVDARAGGSIGAAAAAAAAQLCVQTSNSAACPRPRPPSRFAPVGTSCAAACVEAVEATVCGADASPAIPALPRPWPTAPTPCSFATVGQPAVSEGLPWILLHALGQQLQWLLRPVEGPAPGPGLQPSASGSGRHPSSVTSRPAHPRCLSPHAWRFLETDWTRS